MLNPGKVVATASNYGEHVAEMREVVLERVAGHVEPWLLDFDVFLKATSSVDRARRCRWCSHPALKPQGREIHHESELAVVIGRGGSKIGAAQALDHVLGYTIGLDMTVRGDGDRSRRKSYDTFTPMGPWIVTADEIVDPNKLDVRLEVDGCVTAAGEHERHARRRRGHHRLHIDGDAPRPGRCHPHAERRLASERCMPARSWCRRSARSGRCATP